MMKIEMILRYKNTLAHQPTAPAHFVVDGPLVGVFCLVGVVVVLLFFRARKSQKDMLHTMGEVLSVSHEREGCPIVRPGNISAGSKLVCCSKEWRGVEARRQARETDRAVLSSCRGLVVGFYHSYSPVAL